MFLFFLFINIIVAFITKCFKMWQLVCQIFLPKTKTFLSPKFKILEALNRNMIKVAQLHGLLIRQMHFRLLFKDVKNGYDYSIAGC